MLHRRRECQIVATIPGEDNGGGDGERQGEALDAFSRSSRGGVCLFVCGVIAGLPGSGSPNDLHDQRGGHNDDRSEQDSHRFARPDPGADRGEELDVTAGSGAEDPQQKEDAECEQESGDSEQQAVNRSERGSSGREQEDAFPPGAQRCASDEAHNQSNDQDGKHHAVGDGQRFEIVDRNSDEHSDQKDYGAPCEGGIGKEEVTHGSGQSVNSNRRQRRAGDVPWPIRQCGFVRLDPPHVGRLCG